MRQIYFATKNKGKVSSLKRVLSQYGIKVIHSPMDLPEPRTDDLREIAKEKVLAAYQEVKKSVIALDAGFYIPSLNGFPGAFVNLVLKTIGIEGILKLIETKSGDCEFRDCLAYFDSKLKEPLIFEPNVVGALSAEPRGKIKDYAWSELFLIFIPDGEQKTLAEMTEEEYRVWHKKYHQKSYATEFANWFLEQSK